jgi:hypothetical protein
MIHLCWEDEDLARPVIVRLCMERTRDADPDKIDLK